MLGFDDIQQLAHSLEDALATLRDGKRWLDGELADLLFRAFDMLAVLVAETADRNTTLGSRATELVLMLRAWQNAPQQPAIAETPAPRVLLIEDSATVRALETMVLSEAGYVVDAVADGKQALALALAHSYDLVVSGAETRGLRGLDLARALRAIPSRAQVPVIVISSDNTAEHRARASAAGVRALVQRGSVDHQPLLEAAQQVLASDYTVNHRSVRQAAPPGVL
jgi:CheY-like chemotaxis protein